MSDLTKIVDRVIEAHDNDLRVCQLFSNLFDMMAKDGRDPFFVDDSKLLKYMEKFSNGDIEDDQ